MESQEPKLRRINTTSKNNNWVIPVSDKEAVASWTVARSRHTSYRRLSSLLKSLLGFLTLPPATPTLSFSPCKWHSLSSSRLLSLVAPSLLSQKFTATLFGYRHGHVSFALQEQPRSDPVFIIQIATSTSALVQEMSSGQVRISLECEKHAHPTTKLFQEPFWTMYCNRRMRGHAAPRESTELDLHVLRTIQDISVGAGVIPMKGGSEGEMLYMRAKFERVVGNQDSEAYYMLNPDGKGVPELSIFLLRI